MLDACQLRAVAEEIRSIHIPSSRHVTEDIGGDLRRQNVLFDACQLRAVAEEIRSIHIPSSRHVTEDIGGDLRRQNVLFDACQLRAVAEEIRSIHIPSSRHVTEDIGGDLRRQNVLLDTGQLRAVANEERCYDITKSIDLSTDRNVSSHHPDITYIASGAYKGGNVRVRSVHITTDVNVSSLRECGSRNPGQLRTVTYKITGSDISSSIDVYRVDCGYVCVYSGYITYYVCRER